MKAKIRFVEIFDKEMGFLRYELQVKRFFRWRYFNYCVDLGYGYVVNRENAPNKLELLQKFIKSKRTSKEFIEIIEHPQLRIY